MKRPQIDELDKMLNNNLAHVLEIYNQFRREEGNNDKQGKRSLYSTLGAHNSDFAHVDKQSFSNENEYLICWLEGLIKTYGTPVNSKSEAGTPYVIIRLLKKDEICRDFVLNFQKRTFYRYYEAFTRRKPDEELETIWFGNNENCWALYITPINLSGKVYNDHSEIRHVKFDYWTVSHLLTTGLYSLKDSHKSFSSVKEIEPFLLSFPKDSSSPYELEFIQEYIKYLHTSSDPAKEPLLIPEFRYDGKANLHKWRMDFLIINSYTGTKVCIELSPSSTHPDFEREMSKRNDYLNKYNIATITFTNRDLSSIPSCFERIKPFLSDREQPKRTIEEILNECKTKYEFTG